MREVLGKCIVIPCYNEEKVLSLKEYSTFLDTTPEAIICFVNDGSTDKTLQVLTLFQEKYSDQMPIISLLKNLGKAEAVRKGINYCNQNFNHQLIGFHLIQKHLAHLNASYCNTDYVSDGILLGGF